MKLSIVTTLYCSAPTLVDFVMRTTAAARDVAGEDYEILLVNDGSPDDSLKRAIAMQENNSHLVVIDLSRNFGHHKAMMTGLAHATGDYVFLIDSDLEEPPELLTRFWSELAAYAGTDVVYGVQEHRKGGWFERVCGELYYSTMNLLSSVKIPRNCSVVRLMTRRFVDSLLLHSERELVFVGLTALTGYAQRAFTFTKESKGVSSYNLLHKLDLVANSVASFSTRPLMGIFYLGVFITVSAGLLIGFYIMRYLLHGSIVSGWTSLIVSLWVLGGLILLSLGVIGIYLAKMFSEVKARPLTIVRDIYRSK